MTSQEIDVSNIEFSTNLIGREIEVANFVRGI